MPNNEYLNLLKTPQWQKRKAEIMSRDNFTCQICGRSDILLHVHHWYYIDGRDPWDYPDSFLVTLCEECHNRIHRNKIFREAGSSKKENISNLVTTGTKTTKNTDKGTFRTSGILWVDSTQDDEEECAFRSSSLKDVSFWNPEPANISRIQPIPVSENNKYFLCCSKKEKLDYVRGTEVKYYHTDTFYSAFGDIPDTLSACDLIAVSPHVTRYVHASMKNPSIRTIAELRKECVPIKKTVIDNPADFPFSKYGVIFKEKPSERKIARYRGIPIETIVEIVRWIYEDYSIPISASYSQRLNGAFCEYIDHLNETDKESFYSIFDIEEYYVSTGVPHRFEYSIFYSFDFDQSSLSRTIDNIYFKGYQAYHHKTEWLQHPELKTLGDYIEYVKKHH